MKDTDYIIYLEGLVEKMLSDYIRYQKIIDGPNQDFKPELRKLSNKIPALFKSKREF